MMTILYQPGERVYRYVWVGGENQEPQALTIISRSRSGKTYQVQTDEGSIFRVAAEDIIDLIDWETA